MKLLNEFLQWLCILLVIAVLVGGGFVGFRFYEEHKATIERVNELGKLLNPKPWNPFSEESQR